jgi:hypothetical protein
MEDLQINRFVHPILSVMTLLSNELFDLILEHLSKDDRLASPPTSSSKSGENHSIHSGNYFFKEPTDIQPALNEISEKIEKGVKTHIGSHGEFIKGTISTGYIWDSGKSYFEIKGGFYFEVYCFACKSLTFIRLTHERTLYAPEKEWLSIDMDEEQNTVWLDEQ